MSTIGPASKCGVNTSKVTSKRSRLDLCENLSRESQKLESHPLDIGPLVWRHEVQPGDGRVRCRTTDQITTVHERIPAVTFCGLNEIFL